MHKYKIIKETFPTGILSAFKVMDAFMLQVYLCGDSAEAKQAVTVTATKLGFTVLDRGSLSAARELEDFPLQLFPEWRLPLWLAFGLTVVLYIYVIIRDVIWTYASEGRDISFRIIVSLPNKVQLMPFIIMKIKRNGKSIFPPKYNARNSQ